MNDKDEIEELEESNELLRGENAKLVDELAKTRQQLQNAIAESQVLQKAILNSFVKNSQ